MRLPWSAAVRANNRGNALAEAGQEAAADACYGEAARLAPDWAVPLFNLGLSHKLRGRWRECLEVNLKACELTPAAGEPCWWNLAIAATALRDWATARRAWSAFGIPIPHGDGPIDLSLGGVPIRLTVHGSGEVVWCSGLDPARAQIMSIPLPRSGHHYHDVLLHDGTPHGHRKLGDEEVPVFDELAILEPSTFVTHEVQVQCQSDGDIGALAETVEAAGGAMEDWTDRVRMICDKCSAGLPHQHPDVDQPSWQSDRQLGLAFELGVDVQALLRDWATSGRGRITH
jgi:hypothetical protein